MNLNDKIMDEDGYRVVYSKYDYALLRVSKEKICMNDELALLVTIPRQSGNQRLVRLSYDNILSSTKSICKCLDITYNDVAITSMPMSYVYGMFVLNTHLYKKATIILNTECYYTEKFWKHFQMYGGTSFSGVPYMYEILIAKGVFNNDMKNLKNMTVSGGKLGYTDEKYLIKYAEKYNKRITVMYGYAEATAQICYRPYQDISRKIGSIGIAIPDGSMWLENQQRDIVDKPFIHGDIIYGGRNVCMGYAYNYKDLEKGDVNNGIFRTGDIGYIDENGYFYILDRSNGSENVDDRRFKLKEMERQLREKYYV
jgi:acyl-CoA synthetase (AMP-forming)/AMP-acid ligase II